MGVAAALLLVVTVALLGVISYYWVQIPFLTFQLRRDSVSGDLRWRACMSRSG